MGVGPLFEATNITRRDGLQSGTHSSNPLLQMCTASLPNKQTFFVSVLCVYIFCKDFCLERVAYVIRKTHHKNSWLETGGR